MADLHQNRALDQAPLSVFDAVVSKLSEIGREREIIPLHQGKTAFTTPLEHLDDAAGFDFPAYIDGPSAGAPTLISAVTDTLEARTQQQIDPRRIQITGGITHALSIVFNAILDPLDEVILLSPQWLFAAGLVRAAAGIPVEVPWFTEQGAHRDDLCGRLEAAVTARSRAIYLNVPNNPTGQRLGSAQLRQLVAFAAQRGLWVIADNAYEHYDFSAEGFTDPVCLAQGNDNVFSAYSFSKSFGMTGYRIGYLLSPAAIAERVRKCALYSIYSSPTVCQHAALLALRSDPDVMSGHVAFVRQARDITVAQLEVPTRRPEGGFYAFLDLSEWPLGVSDFIDRCVDRGVSLAPGGAFGSHTAGYARLCYSVVEHAELKRGIDIVNAVFAQRSSDLVAATAGS